MTVNLRNIGALQWIFVALGVFSSLAIHVRFYVIDAKDNILPLIDYVFFANVSTVFLLYIALSAFISRFTPLFTLLFITWLSTFRVNLTLLVKRSKIKKSFFKRIFYILLNVVPLFILIDETRKRHRHAYIYPAVQEITGKYGIYIKITFGLSLFSYLYVGVGMTLISAFAIFLISAISFSIEYRGKINISDNILKTIYMNVSTIVIILTTIVLISSAIFGYARNVYMKNLDPIYLESHNFNGYVIYVGRVSDGIIFRGTENGSYFFVPISGQPFLR